MLISFDEMDVSILILIKIDIDDYPFWEGVFDNPISLSFQNSEKKWKYDYLD